MNKLRWFSLFAILFILVACSKTNEDSTYTSETGFVFSIDPQSETVSLSTANVGALSAQAVRELVPGEDLDLASYSFTFVPGNMLEINASFKNVTSDLEFSAFSFAPSGDNYLSSVEPTVSDDDLGGDGVLSPGETTSELGFKVNHKGEPFSYFVTVSADVDGEDGGTVEVVGVVPGPFDDEGGSFEITVLPKDADGNLVTGGVTLDDFSFTNISIALDSAADTPLTDGTAIPTDLEIITSSDPVSLILDFDSSGSMEICCGRNDRDRLRVQAGKDLIDLIGSDDKAAILDFGAGTSSGLSSSRLLQDFSSDKTALKNAIDRVTSSGGTPLYNSLLDALSLLEDASADNDAIVVLTDGVARDSQLFGAVVSQAEAQDVPIFPIGLGNNLDFSELQSLASDTGGTFGEASDADALQEVFMNIGFGIVNGRVIVTGQVTFGSPLANSGDYIITGNLVTNLGGNSVSTPFSFPVTITF